MMIPESTGLTYPVVEVFHSIQGEGVWVGSSAFFIRLGGCDVGCWFCDTKVSWNPMRHPQLTISELVRRAIASRPAMVIITGGEPLMHDLTALTDHLHGAGLRVHLETSGAHPLRGKFDWITLSPKPFKLPLEEIYGQVDELKVVVSTPEDLIWAEEQALRVTKTGVKFLQPEWATPEARQMVFDYVLQHPEWRMSVQIHKYLKVQ